MEPAKLVAKYQSILSVSNDHNTTHLVSTVQCVRFWGRHKFWCGGTAHVVCLLRFEEVTDLSSKLAHGA